MGINNYFFIALLGCCLVTAIPRVLPFAFVKIVKLPARLVSFLEYLPLCILGALLFQSILVVKAGVVTFDLLKSIALIPTILVAVYTKDLMKTVLVGVIVIAILRFFF
ncbi:MAG: AzlD domain-containing protein [Clostridiales Family XIII bacterium]|jgi:branched-subunit amino acid transport protein|nr:AzlD domain-containing protein [Clostridiales Family XIII bacterium]